MELIPLLDLINTILCIILIVASIHEYRKDEVQHAIYLLLMSVACRLDVVSHLVLN